MNIDTEADLIGTEVIGTEADTKERELQRVISYLRENAEKFWTRMQCGSFYHCMPSRDVDIEVR